MHQNIPTKSKHSKYYKVSQSECKSRKLLESSGQVDLQRAVYIHDVCSCSSESRYVLKYPWVPGTKCTGGSAVPDPSNLL